MPTSTAPPVRRILNPFRSGAVYWRGRHGRLRRLLTISFLGHAVLVLSTVLMMFIPSCKKTYDLVKGSGKPKAMIKQMKVQVKKVQRKKILVNANSPIVFEIPPLELMPLNLKQVTANEYKIGQGEARVRRATRRGAKG